MSYFTINKSLVLVNLQNSFHYPNLPRQDGSHGPRGQADQQRPRLGAHVAGLQRLTDGVVPLEGYRQDRQDARVCHRQLHKWDRFAWKEVNNM